MFYFVRQSVQDDLLRQTAQQILTIKKLKQVNLLIGIFA